MTARITFDVAGLPVPQGALVRSPSGGLYNRGAAKLADWRQAIATEARREIDWLRTGSRDLGGGYGEGMSPPAGFQLLEGPVRVDVVFRLPRPAGQTGKRGLLPSAPSYPATRPDIDKLLRASLDALTGVVFADDAQVSVVLVRKDYAEPGRQPGASFEISERLP